VRNVDSDATLDADLISWFADRCDLPRLTLLGPVAVRAHGTPIAKRKPYYTELVAYLALRPHGATCGEIADAFNITVQRVRNDIKIVRDWLGVDPRTGRLHLPDARDSHAARHGGISTYQIDGLLFDLQLFDRLLRRAHRRNQQGQDSTPDRQRALNFVTGRPFDQLRPAGWTWLLDGDRIDQHAIADIIRTSHHVSRERLKRGEYAAARAAARIGVLASPEDEQSHLDLNLAEQTEKVMQDRYNVPGRARQRDSDA
jgi:hypothetical protein